MNDLERRHRLVKLYFQQKVGEEIVVDSITATNFGEFLIVKVAGIDDLETVNSVMQFVSEQTGKKVLVLYPGADLEFYGVEVDE